MKKVCLYYHYPIAINEAWDVSKAVDIYKNYDIIVFGDECNAPNQEVYFSTVQIIKILRSDYPDIEIFEQVPCTTSGGGKNLSTHQIKALIDSWHDITLIGIFYY